MDYKIIYKEAFEVRGKAIKVSMKDPGHHKQITEFWNRCHEDGTCEKICGLDNERHMLGISMEFDGEEFSYMIAIENLDNKDILGLETREIPAASWAIFTSVGPMPQAIVNVLSRIYQEWFPATGFEQANAPLLEVYLPGDPSDKDYQCEVWVPILKQ